MFEKRSQASRRVAATILWAALIASPSLAVEQSVAFEITVTNSGGSAVFSVPYDACSWSPDRQAHGWSDPFPVPLVDGSGQTIATLSGASFEVRYSPVAEVNVNFQLVAGDELTTIEMYSPLHDFPTIPAADANARTTVSMTISDEDSSGFAEFRGLGVPGTGSFQAHYNGRGPSAPTFASLIYSGSVQSPIPNTPAGTLNVSDQYPDIGFLPVGADVSSISVYLGVTVTPNDLFGLTSGMSMDQAVPPPPCPGDVDGDGTIGLNDLSLLLASFDDCEGGASYQPLADMDGDACVTLTDLAMMLSAFDAPCQ